MPNRFRNKRMINFHNLFGYNAYLLIYFDHQVKWKTGFVKTCTEIKTACPGKHIGPNFRGFLK